jgi:hypothetical protein
MDGLSSTEFAFVAALYLFSPTALQAQQGDFGQMLRAAAPGEARQLMRQADADLQLRPGPDGAAQLAQAAAARARKLQREREAYAAASAAWRQARPTASGLGETRPMLASSTAP